jgi:hypothetical protein
MLGSSLRQLFFIIFFSIFALASSSSFAATNQGKRYKVYNPATYEARMPSRIAPEGQKVIIVNPRVHAWAAYNDAGALVRGGQATAGSSWCADLGRPCQTRSGSFHIVSLGSSACKSSKFPRPNGGAPMPYCMFFNHGQALHGSYEVVDANVSHGCVRLHVQDAEWIRFNFASVGTKVVVLSY